VGHPRAPLSDDASLRWGAAAARLEWVLHPDRDPERARTLARELDAPIAVAEALVNRGVHDAASAEAFFEPALDRLHDPYVLLGLDRAVERIRAARARDEAVMVHGDYDVDGITSTFLLHHTLTSMGMRASYRIPHRMRDGYGLTDEAVDDAARRGCTLIVTVDCGITAVEVVARAAARGIDTVITDHHEPGGTLPPAAAIVNPRQPGCPYPFKSLAGVGVTYKLACALLAAEDGALDPESFLDLVAIGTIADVVPLVGENRALARHGLRRLRAAPRLGLRALLEVSGLADREVSSGQVAFVLAPRINAAGRMGNAEQGLRLLMARDPDEARALAESLEEDNDRRRVHDEEALLDASRALEREDGWPNRASILLWSDRWHPGVIGIVASRLVERYQRPALLIALDGARGRGSGRSVPGLDLNRLLDGCADLLDGHGGHALAAGLTVRRERLPELRDRFETLVAAQMTPGEAARPLTIDGDVHLAACDDAMVGWLSRLAPHGLGNLEPVFRTASVRATSVSAVGGGRHLKMTVREEGHAVEAIGFGMGTLADGMRGGRRCDVAFVPTLNDWMGTRRIQLKLKGIRPW